MHDFTYREGLKMEPARENGRRCLDADELGGLGLALDRQGRWSDPLMVSRARRSFTKPLRRATQAVEATRAST
jgi:hypothetical protein